MKLEPGEVCPECGAYQLRHRDQPDKQQHMPGCLQRIGNVYVFANGNVMVFDMHGQQMPEYQRSSWAESEPLLRAAGWTGEPRQGGLRR